jgi:hypothetical protein
MSVIVSDGNKGARRLYERCGYHFAATRPMDQGGVGQPRGKLGVAHQIPLEGRGLHRASPTKVLAVFSVAPVMVTTVWEQLAEVEGCLRE